MRISSPAFPHEGMIPAKYSREGENVSPPLEFGDVPERAKSLVLIVEDPDVPAEVRQDGMWDHWVVFNIDPTTRSVAEASNPPGTIGVNTNGENAYGGPNPPDGEHRYFFKLYALDSELSLPTGAAKAQVQMAMQEHVLASAELMGRYIKPQS